MRIVVWAGVLAGALAVPGDGLFAQAFPDKLVRIVIPFSLGGSTDTNARVLMPHLIERWKQQVIVEPRPGAATTIGTEYASKADPDGHTILFTSTQFAYAPSQFRRLPYDPFGDLVPITLVTKSPQMIVAHPALPVSTPKQLVALARSRPGELSLGNAGSVLPSHLFFMLSKTKIVPVPYKGAGPLMQDLMGGHVPLAMAAISSVQGTLRMGRAKVIGICSLTPSPLWPDAPVIAKEVPGFEAVAWFGMFAPRGTPPHLVQRIRDDIAAVLQIPSVQKQLIDIGGDPSGMPPAEFARYVRAEIEKWNKVAKAIGFKPN